jgi:DNA-binding MltR family transcriptional regulator
MLGVIPLARSTMHPEDTLDLDSFLRELQRESDRGLALVAAALIDEKLLETLQSFMCECKAAEKLLVQAHAPLGTFSSRIEACFALGLIDEFEYQEITLLRKVRNEFAHSKHGMSFQNEQVKSLCSSFQSHLPPGTDIPTDDARFRFINATVTLVLRLYYRAGWVSPERRKTKSWVPEKFSKWHSTAQEPPAGATVIAIVNRTPKEPK